MTHFKRARPGTDSGTAPGSVPGPDQCLFTLSGPDTALTRPSTLPPFVFNGDVPTSQCKLRHFRESTRLSALIYKWAEHGDLFTLQIDRAEHRQCGPNPVDPGRVIFFYACSGQRQFSTFSKFLIWRVWVMG